ncbi:MAG: V-type ATP synthase subunit D [Candidatus Micrarchaeia archaeon]
MESNIKTTRIELIRTRRRIAIAKKGLTLLKMKRSSLVLEFFNLARQIQKLMGSLGETVTRARESIHIADVLSGRIILERIAAEQSSIGASVEAKNVMGVKIPNISIEKGNRMPESYELISVPAPIEDARSAYAQLFNMLIEIAEKENALRKLLHEIEKLNRRSNAIENVAIPAMQEKAKYIRQRLEDMERDNIVSLKFIKGKISSEGE